jgi:hypothetical protein
MASVQNENSFHNEIKELVTIGARGNLVVKALRYRLEGRGFEIR